MWRWLGCASAPQHDTQRVSLQDLAGEDLVISVRLLSGASLKVQTKGDATLWMLKLRLYEQSSTLPPAEMRLVRGANEVLRGNTRQLHELGLFTHPQPVFLRLLRSPEEAHADPPPKPAIIGRPESSWLPAKRCFIPSWRDPLDLEHAPGKLISIAVYHDEMECAIETKAEVSLWFFKHELVRAIPALRHPSSVKMTVQRRSSQSEQWCFELDLSGGKELNLQTLASLDAPATGAPEERGAQYRWNAEHANYLRVSCWPLPSPNFPSQNLQRRACDSVFCDLVRLPLWALCVPRVVGALALGSQSCFCAPLQCLVLYIFAVPYLVVESLLLKICNLAYRWCCCCGCPREVQEDCGVVEAMEAPCLAARGTRGNRKGSEQLA